MTVMECPNAKKSLKYDRGEESHGSKNHPKSRRNANQNKTHAFIGGGGASKDREHGTKRDAERLEIWGQEM